MTHRGSIVNYSNVQSASHPWSANKYYNFISRFNILSHFVFTHPSLLITITSFNCKQILGAHQNASNPQHLSYTSATMPAATDNSDMSRKQAPLNAPKGPRADRGKFSLMNCHFAASSMVPIYSLSYLFLPYLENHPSPSTLPQS